jgi:hypothetical protein
MSNDIQVGIGVQTAGLVSGLSRAQSTVRSATAAMQASFGALRASVGGVLGSLNSMTSAIGVGLSLGAFATSMRTAVNEVAALDDAAESTGNSVERMSSLLNTLRPTGVGLDQITSSLGRLTRAMTAADDESKGAGAAIASLGVKTRDAAGNLRPSADVMDDIAVALEGYRDGANKTALVQAIFGREGAALLPMLRDLATLHREAGTRTTEQAAAAEKAANSIRRLKGDIGQLQQDIAVALIPTFNDMIGKLRSIAAISGNPIKWANFLFGSAADIDKKVADTESEIRRLQGLIDGSIKPDGGKNMRDQAGGSGLLGDLVDRVIGTPQESAAARDRLMQLQRDLQELKYVQAEQRRLGVSGVRPVGSATPGGGPRPDAPATPGGGRPTAAPRSSPLSAFIDAETRALQELGRLFEQAGVTVASTQADLMRRLDQMFFDGLIGPELYEGAIAQLFRTTSAAGKDGVGQLNKELEQQAERWRDIIDPARQYVRQLEEIRRLVAEGKLTRDQGLSAEFDVQSRMEDALRPPKGGEQGPAAFSWVGAAEAGFRRLFSAIQEGSVTTAGVLQGAFGLMADVATGALAKLGAEWLASMVTSKLVSIKTALSDISASAARAGAAAFAATAAIPIVGPGMAPAAAAASYAGAMSFASGLSLASASRGFDIPANVNPLTQLHAREMVLPAEHADTIRRLGQGGPQAAQQPVQVHVHANDARTIEDMLGRDSRRAARLAQRMTSIASVRRGT